MNKHNYPETDRTEYVARIVIVLAFIAWLTFIAG